MFELKDGILKINFNRGILDTLWDISFFLLMISIICHGGYSSGSNYFYYFVFFFFIGMSLVWLISKRDLLVRNFILPLHTVWYGIFIFLCVLSSIWAVSFSVSFVPISKMIQILAVTMCLILCVNSNIDIERYLNIVLAATAYLIAYMFIKTPSENWFSGFLGSVTGYNTNDIGLAVALCVIISFYKSFVSKRYSMYVLFVVSMLAVALTSSRKSLFMSVLGVFFIIAFNQRSKNNFLRILSGLGLLALIFILIYQVPQLYNAVGVRIDSMIEYLSSDKSADSSLALRQSYISLARSFFFQNPLIGNGINNFSYLSGLSGRISTYAHNNYWELAADLGILGLITYYWFYAYLFINLLRHLINGHKTALLFSILLILIAIFEYGITDYYKMQVHLVIAAAYCVVVSCNREDYDNRLKETEAK